MTGTRIVFSIIIACPHARRFGTYELPHYELVTSEFISCL